jgi:hypothetical protein
MTEKRLVIKLDQYAGNVDELVCVALIGVGNERYGSIEARKVYEEKVVPHTPQNEYDDFPLETCLFNTEYGLSSYELDSDSNNMIIGLDGYCTDKDITDAISIWKKAYGNDKGELVIEVPFVGSVSVVKIIGFDLIEIKEIRTTIE